MIIGELRYTLKIFQVIKEKQKNGSFTVSNFLIHSLRASRKYLTGSKIINNEEIFNTRTLQFITYYRKGITESCIIEFENRKYKINFLEVIGYNEALKFDVELINN